MHADLPLPRLLDQMGAEDGPSDAEEEKEAKRYRSTSTTPRSTTPRSSTPRSTSGTLPHEYDTVMGIAPVEPPESERFEEGDDSDYHHAEDAAAHNREIVDKPVKEEEQPVTDTTGIEEFQGYGGASLRE